MNARASALYPGQVTHHRVKPRDHKLSYSVFSLLLDLDEIDDLARQLKLFSRNRFNAFSFRDTDYGDGSATPLKAQVETHLQAAGLETDGGAIRLMTMPRILGYAFNPLNVFFCHRADGRLQAILYEVNNTFGQRHSYLIPVEDPETSPIRQETRKRFYVSPFLDMGLTYAFKVIPPAERMGVHIAARDSEGLVITATLTGTRTELTDRSLAKAFVTFPLLTLKVIVGIHWEAMQIFLKGIRLRDRPPPPDLPVTVSRPDA